MESRRIGDPAAEMVVADDGESFTLHFVGQDIQDQNLSDY